MKQCEMGHWYDNSKNSYCPYCIEKEKNPTPIVNMENFDDLICEKCGEIYCGEETIPICCWKCNGELQEIGYKNGYERCLNCLKWIEKGEYCIHCGAKKGTGKYHLTINPTDY